MERKTVRINPGDPREEQFKSMAYEALQPQNLRIIARGPENRKNSDIECIEKYGMYFYVAGKVTNGDVYNVFKQKYSTEDLCAAMKNTASSARIGTFEEAVFDEMNKIEDFNPHGIGMYILSNDGRENAAGLMLCEGVMLMLKQKIGDFWIAPSSIHELIIIPVSDESFFDRDYVVSMVREVNHSVVRPDDRLVDNAFFFDGMIH